jgi:hypothetical protein
MPSHRIICEACDAEYSLYTEEHEISIPKHCAFCGTSLPEDNITTNESEWSDEDWDKLADEGFDDEEWKWEDKE